MTCTKCKNPIDVNAIECEWCGMSFSISETQTIEISGLDAELIKLLSMPVMLNGKPFLVDGKQTPDINSARDLYQRMTGKNKWESSYYVQRLNFFRTHNKYANEDAWQREWNNFRKNSKPGCITWFFGILGFFLLIPAIVMLVISFVYPEDWWYSIPGFFVLIIAGAFIAILITSIRDDKEYTKLGL